jgi:Zn-dependent protease
MKCQVCATETLMPFRCPFCGGQFCSAHRLPENHKCPGISAAHVQPQAPTGMTQQGYDTFNYSYVFGQDPYKRKNHLSTSPKELKHIGIAAALVIGIGFSMALYGFSWAWTVMAVFAIIMTASFLTHETAHKIMAQKAGMWAEFRLTTWGSVLTFVSVFLPFKMIAPGAMMIGGNAPTAKDMVKISIAGVITNMIFATIFLGLAFGLPINDYSGMLFFAAYINSFMAVFNLVPFGVLDGYKLFLLNKKVWLLAFVPSVVLAVISGWIIFVA